MKKIILSLLLIITLGFSSHIMAENDNFCWTGSTVYFVITDRFCNGDTSNDVNYGRITDYGSEQMNAATFHGGDFKGMLKKAKEGYFTDMGIDVVWMTDLYTSALAIVCDGYVTFPGNDSNVAVIVKACGIR